MQIDASTILTFWGIPSAVTGFYFWGLKRNITKRGAKREELDNARKKNEVLLIKSVSAAIALGEATAHAIRDGKCNGEMTAALAYAQKVKHEQKDLNGKKLQRKKLTLNINYLGKLLKATRILLNCLD